MNIKPNYEVGTVEDLDKFLKGVLRGIRTKEVSLDEADAISKVADKIVKNNLTRIMYKKLTNSESPLLDFESVVNVNMIQKVV
jgi:hypothetical protein